MENLAQMLYSSYIRYDRMYEMTKFAFYGSNATKVNVYVDVYSLLRNLYSKYQNIEIRDSYAIASCMINLAIHIRGYFESRHHTATKIYLIYGGSRLLEFPEYNAKNILMENSDSRMHKLIIDNLEVMQILCPYLNDIFFIADINNEFSTIASYIITEINKDDKAPNIIYSKSQLAYQLVAYMGRTFLYRPKKSMGADVSWVATKSTLINAYRLAELKLKKEVPHIDYKLMNVYQTISGVRDRSIPSLINATNAVKKIKYLVDCGLLLDGYNSYGLLKNNSQTEICRVYSLMGLDEEACMNRMYVIDLLSSLYKYSNTPQALELSKSIVNLYDPETVKNINNKYFDIYPLDLNRA